MSTSLLCSFIHWEQGLAVNLVMGFRVWHWEPWSILSLYFSKNMLMADMALLGWAGLKPSITDDSTLQWTLPLPLAFP